MAAEKRKKVNSYHFLCSKCSIAVVFVIVMYLFECNSLELTIQDIENAALRSCVVAIEIEERKNVNLEPGLETDANSEKNVWTIRENQLRELFGEVEGIFRKISDEDSATEIRFSSIKHGSIRVHDKKSKWSNMLPIVVTDYDFDDNENSKNHDQNADELNDDDDDDDEILTTHRHSPLILGFRKRKRDRSCLIKPDNYLADMPETFVYSGAVDLRSMVNFVNHVCSIYMDVNGQLSEFGTLRQKVLTDLHRLNKDSSFSSMSDFHMTDNNPFKHGLLSDKAEKSLKDRNLKLAQCEKINLPDWKTFLHDYLLKSKPVIFKNVTNNWPAFRKWTNAYLKSKFVNNRIHVKLAPNGVFEGTEDITLWKNYNKFQIPAKVKDQLQFPDLVVVRPSPGSMTFGEFVNFMESEPKSKNNVSAYVEYASIEEYMPGLTADIEEMTFLSGHFKPGHLNHKNVWLSDGNTLGKLHFDAFENFLGQLSGSKQVTMFEPHDNQRLYEAHIQEAEISFSKASMSFTRENLHDSTSMVMSPVDLLKPNFKRFPLFADTVPMNCTISEGEVLYMPSYWWHEVQSTPNPRHKRNLAVNFWYDPFLVKEFPCQDCPLDLNPKYHYLLHQCLKQER